MVKGSKLHNQIVQLLSEKVQVEVPSIETDLMESGLLDSLTLVELIAGLEEECGIKIPFGEIEIDNFRSVARIAEFVNYQIMLREPKFT